MSKKLKSMQTYSVWNLQQSIACANHEIYKSSAQQKRHHDANFLSEILSQLSTFSNERAKPDQRISEPNASWLG